MDRRDNQTLQGEIARILVEFLEVAITSVVLLKGVYPNGAFETHRYMNLVVHRARHPELKEYIHAAVNGLLPFIAKDLVDRVAVIFFDDGDVAIERFVFRISLSQSYSSKLEQADLESSLRSLLIKLPQSQPLTKALPRNCRWEISGYFGDLPRGKEMWVPSGSKPWLEPPLITPIKSINIEPLGLQMYMEHPSASTILVGSSIKEQGISCLEKNRK